MSTSEISTGRQLKPARGFDTIAWTWMRYSGFLLIFLAFGHLALQDVIVGVHKINLDYVAVRWANMGWRIYDILLLSFAFAHGMNGLRQVLFDYVHSQSRRSVVSWTLLALWAIITLIGAISIIGGVRAAG
jgi:succinate dehydrogenase / fumarate reductase membrane anchor subunit